MEILDILKACGVEIAAENKEKFDSAFKENYIALTDYNGLKKQNETATTNITKLTEQLKGFDGVDIAKMKQDVTDWENKYNQDIAGLKLDNEVNKILFQANARNITAVKALLKMDNVKLDNGQVLGLQEQLDGLKKSDGYLFSDAAATNTNGKNPHDNDNNQGQNQGGKTVTVDEFKKMLYLDKCKLQQENPELFKQLSEQARTASGYAW